MDQAASTTGLDTAWVRRVRAGQRPSGDELRAHLLAMHRRNAGFTEICADACRDGDGRTSYEWLAEFATASPKLRVLELACGSGRLLELCRARMSANGDLHGVDMSADELDLAGRRLARDGGGQQPTTALHCGLAQNLDFLDAGSVDVTLCHWALTLMDPVRPVLEETRRVLRPGGVFAAIVDGDMATAAGYGDTHHVIYRHVQREVAAYGDVDLGDPRVRDGAALRALAAEVFGPNSDILVEPNVVRLVGAPRDLAAQAAGFFYASYVLSPAAHREMLEELTWMLTERAGAEPGLARFDMPIRRLVIRKA